MYVFTKDLKQLRADLRATDDKAAVVQRYEDALVAKGQVGVILVGFLFLSYSRPEVRASVRRAGEKRESG